MVPRLPTQGRRSRPRTVVVTAAALGGRPAPPRRSEPRRSGPLSRRRRHTHGRHPAQGSARTALPTCHRSTRIIASTAPTTDATAVPTTDITAAPTTETNTEHIKDPPKSKRSRRVRVLNPLAPDDAALLEAVSCPEFLLNGLRNRDLRLLLFPAPANAQQRHRQAAAVTRKLTLLRAHGILHKVPHTHRYQVSPTGRQATTALLAARAATTEALAAAA